jgi:hypothetical protein
MRQAVKIMYNNTQSWIIIIYICVENTYIIIIIIIIIIWLQLCWHPVAVVQYTFTHKQYTEYTGRSTHNIYKENNWEVNWEVRAVPRLCDLYPGICLTTVEKARKNLS